MGGPQDSAQAEDRVELICATESIRLNASALSDPHSLQTTLSFPTLSDPLDSPDLLKLVVIPALVDSGSTHCFVDSDFVHSYDLPTSSVPPI